MPRVADEEHRHRQTLLLFFLDVRFVNEPLDPIKLSCDYVMRNFPCHDIRFETRVDL